MYKVWVSEGFRLTFIKSYAQSRLILVRGIEPVLVKHYDWGEERFAEKEAEALAQLGHMRVEEVNTWLVSAPR